MIVIGPVIVVVHVNGAANVRVIEAVNVPLASECAPDMFVQRLEDEAVADHADGSDHVMIAVSSLIPHTCEKSQIAWNFLPRRG